MTASVMGGTAAFARVAPAVAAVRAIGWLQLRATFGLGLVAWAFSMLMELPKVLNFVTPLHVVLGRGLLDFQVRAFCLLVAVVIADRAIDEGAHRMATYSLAALAGCLAGVLLGIALDVNWAAVEMAARDPNAPGAPPWQQYGTHVTNTIFATLNWLLFGGSAVFLYADRRAAQKTESLLRAAELERIRKSRLALEARLQVLQARVEPQFLFGTLRHVASLYERDPAAAAQMLDELIAYLRAAVPHMRDIASTLGQEIDLAQAYLGITRLRWGERLVFDVDVPDDARSVPMPPMMLMPLIVQALAPGVDLAGDETELRIGCDVDETRLRVTLLTVGFVVPHDGEGAAAIRERLEALYGNRARLIVGSDGPLRAERMIEIPCDRQEQDVM